MGNFEGNANEIISQQLELHHDDESLRRLRNRFSRDGFIRVEGVISPELNAAVRGKVLDLLDQYAERRDLHLKTTGGTPRHMSVVRSQEIAKSDGIIGSVYRSTVLREHLGKIAGEGVHSCPSEDEEFLITRQERTGDTHGWHWGDFSFALIWIIETPPTGIGGMLQCVPHTIWNKNQPRINEYLCENPVATYGFVPGDLYFLRTDTTLHRTVPLSEDAPRIILNMTWAAGKDLRSGPEGDDRWWEDPEVSAASGLPA